MNFAVIEKQQKIYNKIKELDVKILALEKLALEVDKNPKSLSVSLSAEKQPEVKAGDIIDLDYERPSISFSITAWGMPEAKKVEKPKSLLTINENVDARTFYMFLSFLMNTYKTDRELLIEKIKKLK